MTFPPAGAQIYYNEAGEPLGWDAPSRGDEEAYYDDICGGYHSPGACPLDEEEEETDPLHDPA